MRVRESSRQRKGLCKGTEKPWHKIGKREAPLVEEDEEIERKTTGNIRRRESTELSPLASRLDTNFYFYWSFLRLNCSCSAALGLD